MKQISNMSGRLLIAIAIAVFSAFSIEAQTVHRPISDFINAQTLPILWQDTGYQLTVDYAGRRNAISGLGLPTTVTGQITERALRDGSARVSVTLRADDAYATGAIPGVGRVFGYSFLEVLGGATSATGSSSLQVDFINTAPGAPLPNLSNLFFAPLPGQVVLRTQFVANADGALRAAFGVPEGTPGKARTTQVGLDSNPHHSQTPDVFPAEKVTFWAVGN